ncbi:hypothetical protein SAMN04489716_2497 [Actinoplanes derwentensis]|uniref:Uncharacterized protein n=1 Tax=Actinoplanes derwentensis TaxID=113562 RepID=A0A1H1XKB7_9ACTN|nr:hypothetical protein SAMN04489716_2497 [Actinoplanes derwentensis]
MIVAGAVAGLAAAAPADEPPAPKPAAEAVDALVPPAPAPDGGRADWISPNPAAPAISAGTTGPTPGKPAVPAVTTTTGTASPTTGATTKPGTTATTKPATAVVAKKVTYSAIAGLGCTGAGTSYTRHGWFKDGKGGWWTLASGSTTTGGCNGQFDDMPTSADANAATPGRAMVFGFQTGAGAQSCALDLYVPVSPTVPTTADPGQGRRDVIVNPVHIAVLTGTGLNSTAYSSPSGARTVSQASNHGSWVSLGSYPVSNGTIGVKITDRGIPWGYPVTDPHIAGGAVRAKCMA